jgi:hypothetical protein
VILVPTLFFLLSQVLRYGLKARTKKELIKSPELRLGFASLGEKATREFRWEFFLDSAVLSMVNGLILTFELTRAEYGVALLVAGVAISLAGLVATEAQSNSTVGFLISVLVVLFVSEFAYFTAFGSVIEVLGFSLLPREIFLLPALGAFLILAVLVLLAIAVAVLRIGKTQVPASAKGT